MWGHRRGLSHWPPGQCGRSPAGPFFPIAKAQAGLWPTTFCTDARGGTLTRCPLRKAAFRPRCFQGVLEQSCRGLLLTISSGTRNWSQPDLGTVTLWVHQLGTGRKGKNNKNSSMQSYDSLAT